MIKTIPIPANATEITIQIDDPKIDFTIVEPEIPNKPPTVTDGEAVTITLPINEAILSAAASDPDGTIVSSKWEQVTGDTVSIDNPFLLTTKATFTKEGNYQFKVTVTDDDGATATSFRNITVKPKPVVTTKVFPISSAPVTEEYPRPFAGGMYWNGVGWDGQAALKIVDSPDTYQRFNWFDFEDKVEGQYNWTVLDKYIDDAAAKGKKFYDGGVMPICQGCSGGRIVDGAQLGYPSWMHIKMLADPITVNRPWKSGNSSDKLSPTWVISWNSNIFHTAWENFNLSKFKHLKDTGRLKYISCMDIRGYGNYGEWHNYPWYWYQPKGTTATSASLKRIVDAVIKAFPDLPLVIISAAYDPGNASLMPADFTYYVLNDAKNNWGKIGWRRDNWGAKGSDNHLVNNPGSYNGVKFSSLILEKWKTAPVVGEPTADYSETGDYTDLMREVTLYHASNIGNGNFSQYPINAVQKGNVIAAFNFTGYRIGIVKGNVTFGTDKMTIAIDWTNTGVAPVYENYETWFEIGAWKGKCSFDPKNSFDPKMGLPQIKTTSDDFPIPALAPGTYDLKISIVDPSGVRKQGLPLNSTISCKINL